jgi:hypothetical protein
MPEWCACSTRLEEPEPCPYDEGLGMEPPWVLCHCCTDCRADCQKLLEATDRHRAKETST